MKHNRIIATLGCLIMALIVMCSTATAQNSMFVVKGKVIDSKKEPLVGVTVIAEGSNRGTTTDIGGNYHIQVAAGEKIKFSFIGYQTQTVAVNASSPLINITMADESQRLDDVVVIGYGTIQKKDLTGSIESLGNKELTKSMVVNPAEALNGRVSGVLVTKGSNRPGADMKIEIRGKNSFNFSNEPLYVIDGVPSYSGIRHLNPDDIESIDVLKDASSCAIYGSRGANGVVIVTTKGATHKEGFAIDYNGYIGIKTPTRIPDMLGSEGDGMEYVNFRIQQWKTKMGESSLGTEAFLNANERRHIKNGEYYDWLREFAKDSYTTNHSISASGGTEKTSYTFGLGYMKDGGIAGSEEFTRMTGNIGIEYRGSDRFRMGINSYLSNSNINKGSQDALLNAYYITPIVGRYEPDGSETFTHRPGGRVNPFVQDRNTKNEADGWSFNASAFLSYSPLKGMTIKSQFATQYDGAVSGYWTGTDSQYGMGKTKPYASRSEGYNKNYVWDNTITYDNTFNKKHKISLIGLYSMQKESHQSSGMIGEGLPYESDWHQIQSADQITGVNSNYWEATMISLMGRANYVFDSRYLFTATARYDGTSRLSNDNRWGLMPSFAAGWAISEESFMENIDWINTLKLRVSWGKSGNSNIGHNEAITKLDLHPYPLGGNGLKGLGLSSRLGNPDLRWEMTKEWNYGLDYAFLNNRIRGSVDVYSRTTSDLIMERQVSHMNGFRSIWQNIATTQNRGVELSINTVNISKKDFTWTTNFTFSLNRNKIVDLDGTKTDDRANNRFIGHPMNVIFDVEQDGIWQMHEKDLASKYGASPGWPKILDYAHDGTIDADDYHILGSPSPDFTAGMTNTFTYKNWDLSIYMYGRHGGLYSDPFTFYFLGLNNQDWNKLSVEYWTPENQNNKYPGIGLDCLWTQVLSQVDGSFLKIQNITLGYAFKENLLRKIHLKGLRAYVSVQNPFTFTSYLGSDPEIIGEDLSTQLSLYPMTFSFGLNIKF